MFLKANAATQAMIQTMHNDGNFKRLAGFAESLFRQFFPKLSAYYKQTMETLLASDPALSRRLRGEHGLKHGDPPPFWAAATANKGPETQTVRHVDHANLAWGICAITALGEFNPDEGGHLVLWNLQCVVRFPPGATILIPSAILEHSNVDLPPGQTRESITRYTSGSLFRWVYNGCATDKTVLTNPSPEMMIQREVDKLRRWEDGINMFPKIAEL